MMLFLARSQAQLYLCSVFGQENKPRNFSTRTIGTLAPCPTQMSQGLNVAVAEISASFDAPFGGLVPFRAKSHGRRQSAREGDWLKGLVRPPLPLARGIAYGGCN